MTRFIEWPYSLGTPPAGGAMRPGATEWFAGNHGTLDAEGTGVTLVSSTWTVDPADDDANITLLADTINGLRALVQVQIAAAAPNKTYHLDNVVTDSAGNSFPTRIAVSVEALGRIVPPSSA